MIVSSILMTAGCGALSIARVDNLSQLWGVLVVAGLGIGGIVVPASIITSTVKHDLTSLRQVLTVCSNHHARRPDRDYNRSHASNPRDWRFHRLLRLL